MCEDEKSETFSYPPSRAQRLQLRRRLYRSKKPLSNPELRGYTSLHWTLFLKVHSSTDHVLQTEVRSQSSLRFLPRNMWPRSLRRQLHWCKWGPKTIPKLPTMFGKLSRENNQTCRVDVAIVQKRPAAVAKINTNKFIYKLCIPERWNLIKYVDNSFRQSTLSPFDSYLNVHQHHPFL